MQRGSGAHDLSRLYLHGPKDPPFVSDIPPVDRLSHGYTKEEWEWEMRLYRRFEDLIIPARKRRVTDLSTYPRELRKPRGDCTFRIINSSFREAGCL